MSDTPETECLQPRSAFDGWIVLVEHDPAWFDEYARQRDLIRATLGKRALQLEHVGSTSVRGLAAKPIIDIALVVADPADEGDYVPDLEAAAYVLWLREPDWHQHRLAPAPTAQTTETRRQPSCFRSRLSRGGSAPALSRPTSGQTR